MFWVLVGEFNYYYIIIMMKDVFKLCFLKLMIVIGNFRVFYFVRNICCEIIEEFIFDRSYFKEFFLLLFEGGGFI